MKVISMNKNPGSDMVIELLSDEQNYECFSVNDISWQFINYVMDNNTEFKGSKDFIEQNILWLRKLKIEKIKSK